MLWVDKYRPKTLDRAMVHEEIATNLKKLVAEQDCPHLLFYGPSGPGKKTIIMTLLRRIFGPSAEKRYSASFRLILCCNSSSNVTEAIRSRCLNIRVNAPSEEQIIKVLEFILKKKEGLQLPFGFAARIAKKSNRSLRRAMLSFETYRVQQYPFTNTQTIPPMDWEEYIYEIATDIMKEQSPKRLFQVRGKVYELLINCIPPEMTLKRLLHELLKKLDAELKHEVCHWAAYYEHRMHLGQKAIFHIEAFVARFMSIYKAFLIATFG
ncbi:replication factor C subunit 3-like [Hibiscus syriacus]|uniref:replication factor C subunit 3-like n=1 Tax=Hibiscus syriacus TaxID=106335 RepID=UPI001924D7A1|nr:replication factor C subunit 3-like [Hibiscus syriacus]